MLRNYFKIALRNLLKHKLFSLINIISLGISMTIGLLIILMLADQKRYDHFHVNKHQIYRINSTKKGGSNSYATSPMPLIEELKIYEGVNRGLSLTSGIGGDLHYQQNTIQLAGYFTTSQFFDLFSFELAKGNPATALEAPKSLVLTHQAAEKIFGEEDPLGKVVSFDDRGLDVYGFWFDVKKPVSWGDFVVTGVLKEPPYKSHLKFDILASAATIPLLEIKKLKFFPDDEWQSFHSNYSYIFLPENKTEEEMESILEKITADKYSASEKPIVSFDLQPLTKITPGPMLNNSSSITLPAVVYYVLSVLALIIILLAAFNYTNLSIARSLTRAKEVGIRKVSGATRKQLIIQFLGESIIISLLSLLFAMALLIIIKPAFMALWVNRYLDFNLKENILIYLFFILFAIFIGVVAGIIPGLYLSKYKPVQVLNKFIRIKPTDIPILKKLSLYKLLVISQFSIALFFIITTILISRQVNHFVTMDYGFNPDRIVNVELQGNDYIKVKNEFGKVSNVKSISGCEFVLCSGISQGVKIKENETDEEIQISSMTITPEFIEHLDIELLAGRNFENDYSQKQERFIIVNQQTLPALHLQKPVEAIGKSLIMEGLPVTIIGVVKDFNYHLPFTKIEPFAFRYQPENLRHMNIKLGTTSNTEKTLQQLEATWKEVDPVHAMEYAFFKDQLKSSFQIFNDIGKLIGFFAFLAIGISCFGLIGITTFSTESRLKEVSVRKVMGAKIHQIIFTLSRGLILLILISIVISAPFSYIINNLWLQQMVNKTEFSWDIMLFGILLTLVLGLMSVVIQTIKVARSNPVLTLNE